MLMDKDFHKTFETCPACGSDQLFLKELGEELKERGLARPVWRQTFDSRQGVCLDKDRAIMLPIGASLPGYYITTDICMDCGTVFATELRRMEAKTTAMPPPGKMPSDLSGLGNIGLS